MKIAFLDIETTGILKDGNKQNHRIIELAVQIYDSATRELLSEFNERIHPMREIDSKAYEVHKISLDDLKNCLIWEDVAPKFVDFMKGVDVSVAHNGYDFDFQFIALELDRINLPFELHNGFDTMVEGRWATTDGKLPKLSELCFATDIEYNEDEAHSAIYDVEVMAKAFFKGVDFGFFKIGD